jgi:RNA polymerase-binding transcription factor DksA
MSEADNFDRASDLEIAQTESSIAAVRNAAKPEQVKVGGEWRQKECEDCGDEIPIGRLDLGRIRCIACQEALERRRAGR